MKTAKTAADIRTLLAPHRGKSRIALVPTMGCLHRGHISLIRKARKTADVVVVSIYVNPMQFGPNEDLKTYPRPIAEDMAACRAEDVDCVFHPETLYAGDGPMVTLAVSGLADCLCGEHRPGHFDGVATVVSILFNIVQPDIAVFGEKDWQQLVIIRRMVADLHMPVDIITIPTVRENDGLAMSSRNRYLSNDERLCASQLNKALTVMAGAVRQGETDTGTLVSRARAHLASHGITPEYLEVRTADNLKPVKRLNGMPARAFVAANIGGARLIDNMPLEAP